jgi:O-antigen/teichoic acid export membrane protein
MEHHGHGNVYGTILTVVFLFISKFTVSDLAAWAAVLAGFTTAGYNIWRFIRERNNKKNKKE